MPTFVAFLETDLLVASKPERPRSPGRAGRKPGYWPCGARGDSAAMGNRRPYRDKTRKHRFLWATRPVFFESLFSSARLSVISGCAAGARLRIGSPCSQPLTEP